jgi:hypothetical protein
MYLIDHNDPVWQARVRRINGALTYSEDLGKYQVPKWEKILPYNSILSTCPKFSELIPRDFGSFDIAVQYLHSYPYSHALERVQHVRQNLPFKTKDVFFISAYKQFAQILNTHNLKTLYCPMGIDAGAIQKFRTEEKYEDRIIYFGNIVQNKSRIFRLMKNEAETYGLKFDYISKSKLNNEIPLTREETLQTIAKYKYGIGVGRCAQELFALGVQTIIAGQRFGGLIMTNDDYELQLGTNMNGRVVTFSQNIRQCLERIDKSIVRWHDIAKDNHANQIISRYKS